MASLHSKEEFARLLDLNLRKVFYNEYQDLPKMIPTLYNVQKSDRSFEEYWRVSGLPDVPAFGGKLTYVKSTPGYYTKIEPKVYAVGTMFDRTLLDDKKFAVMDDHVAALGQAAARTQEKLGVRPFQNAFSSAFDFMTSEEALSLCNTAHTTKSGVSTSSGFSNSGTAALSPTSVAAKRIEMMSFRDDNGERIGLNPDTLIVPITQYDRALEITGTPKSLDTAEGNINPQAGRFKVIPYLRLDDSSTKNWFMVDSNMMKKYLIWVNRITPDYKTTFDFETFSMKNSVYFRVANGFTGWRWISGNNVS